ncbi:MAG: DUF1553 domain-containing protein [Verrucomicrobiaceae bacterium]|nr:DUF1553 domain-containing protein [Verrucomicrobiaceae bacterium]
MMFHRLCLFLPLLTLPLHGAVDFSHQIVPILKKHCAECHLGDKKKAGLSMNTRAELLEGSENGPVVVAGKPEVSSLIEVLVSTDKDTQMPPKGARLSAEEVELLRQWVKQGLVWEEGFTFGKAAYEPPLRPRQPSLPAPSSPERTHPIDRIVDAYLKEHQQRIPKRASAETLQRRLHMDLVGLLPGDTAETTQSLLKRDVDYAEHWLSFWNDLLRNDYVGTGYIDGGRKPITTWLYQSLVSNKPFDQFARELLAPTPESEGFIFGIKWRGNVNASQTREVQFAQSISQVFLGINMKCASCHDSFIDRWKLDEAYALAAVYAETPQEIFRCDKPTGRTAKAAWIFPEIGQVKGDTPQPERLAQLAALMTHRENGRFTRTIANRLWHRLMGRGIVHPVDAMHTEPWSADLLDHLATYLSDNGYDLKQLLLHIATSEAYQSETSTSPSEPDAAHYIYTGPIARRLTAEQFMDAVWSLTKTHPRSTHPSVLRGKPDPSAKVTAQWIWKSADAKAEADEAITFRKVVELEATPISASALITADNSYSLYVNNREIGNDDTIANVEVFPLNNAFKKGANVITVVVKNGGKKPNPAGLLFEARLKMPTGADLAVLSDQTWDWNPQLPQVEARAIKPIKGGWQSAAVVKNHAWGGAITLAANRAAGRMSTGGTEKPVRASLVVSDLLQRSLGRPNREQIVSVRPENLTTLEAIDLANGTILAELLKRGAETLSSSAVEPEQLVKAIYRQVFARQPSNDEVAAAMDILGDKPGAQNIEDMLWAVLLTPEFQFIR